MRGEIFINSNNLYEEYVKNIDSLMQLPQKLNDSTEAAKRKYLNYNNTLEKEKESSLADVQKNRKLAEDEYANIRGELSRIGLTIMPRVQVSRNENCADIDFLLKKQANLAIMIRKQINAVIKRASEQEKEKMEAAKELAERSRRLKKERELKEKRRKYWEEKEREEEEKARELARKQAMEEQERLKKIRRNKNIKIATTAVILIVILCIALGFFSW